MANINVYSSGNIIDVYFGDTSGDTGFSEGVWQKKDVHFTLSCCTDFIDVIIVGDSEFTVSHDGNGETMQIDSVDGVAPTSTQDLYNKLKAMLI